MIQGQGEKAVGRSDKRGKRDTFGVRRVKGGMALAAAGGRREGIQSVRCEDPRLGAEGSTRAPSEEVRDSVSKPGLAP